MNSKAKIWISNWTGKTDFLFPERSIYVRNWRLHYRIAFFLAVFPLFYLLGSLVPVDGFIGFDWVNFFGQGRIPPFYPPWTEWVVSWLNWPALVGLTFASVSLAALLRSVHVISFASVFLSLPLLWTLFLGQLDGLVLLGVLGLPMLAPLALIKPQVAIFSFGVRREYLLALLIVLFLSILIWGFWPGDMFEVWTVHEEGTYVNDIAIGLLGLPIALVLFWFSRGDIDMLMLAGCFMTPYLLPYNLVVVVPAIARLSPLWAVIACLFSWLPLSANWLGPVGWWLGWIFVIWLWIGLAVRRG